MARTAGDARVASTDLDELKRVAALRAAEMVESGSVVGLGTGSTARHAVQRLGERLREGSLRDVLGVPTSDGTARIAELAGIPLTTLEEHPVLDLTIDGADEVDPALDLIKGLGGALLREKIVALASRRLVIVVDHTKRVARLGERAPVPVEVVRFGWGTARAYLESLGARVTLRRSAGGDPFVTDEGHLVLDSHFGAIGDPARLSAAIRARCGVVEHGLFLSLASIVLVSGPGGIEELAR